MNNLIKTIVFTYLSLNPFIGALGASNLAPATTPGEQAALALGEAFTTIAEGVVTKTTCDEIAFTYRVEITTGYQGNGTGSLNGTIIISSQRIQSNISGSRYLLTQAGQGALIDHFIQNYRGEFSFGMQGDTLRASTTFEQKQFGVFSPWETTHINDMWADQNSYGQIYLMDGVDAVLRSGLPQSKWRKNGRVVRPLTSNGLWRTTKSLISPNNSVQCTITLSGVFNLLFGGVYFKGMLSVSPF